MATTPTRSDPIREKYFDPLETAENVSDILFYAGVVLSLAVWLIDEHKNPPLSTGTQIAFLVIVTGSFMLGHFIRVYLTPRALDERVKNFLSTAYNVPLNHLTTVNYYNNSQTDPTRRIAAQTFENSLFSKEITRSMARNNRWVAGSYVILFFIAMYWRSSSLAFISILAQAVLSEQIISRFVRLEWLRMRFEKTYQEFYRLFQSKPGEKEFNVMALESFSTYESAKALGGVTLSSKTFEKLNPELSKEWNQIRATLGV